MIINLLDRLGTRVLGARAWYLGVRGRHDEQCLMLCIAADYANRSDQPEKALGYLRQADQVCVAHEEIDDDTRVFVKSRLGGSLAGLALIDEARAQLEAAEKLLGGAGESADQLRVQVLMVLGGLELQASNPSRAVELLREATELGESVLSGECVLPIRIELAHALRYAAEYTLASEEFRRCLQEARRAEPAEPEIMADINLGLGCVLRAEGRYTEALEYLDAALQEVQPLFGAGHSLPGVIQSQRAFVFARLKELPEAESSLSAARSSNYGETPGAKGWLRSIDAMILLARGDAEAACEAFEEAIEIAESMGAPLAVIHEEFSDLLESQGNLGEAAVHRDRAKAIQGATP